MSSESECEVGAIAASDSDNAASRKRQLSVPDMVRQVEQKRAGQQRVRQFISPRASGHQQPLSESVTLEAIERLIETGNGKVITALEAKFEQVERRLEVLESESFEKDLVIQRLQDEVMTLRKERSDMGELLEGIDMNRRLSSLILTCDDFGPRSYNDDIELMTIQLLNQRLPDLKLTTNDIQVAHRLQNDSKVIVQFFKRRVRDDVYERRFELFSRGGGGGVRAGRNRDASSGLREMAPLYIAESLVPRMQKMFQALLAARREENGAKIASVFSRRGHVYCKKERGGENIRVKDEDHLRQLLGRDVPLMPGSRDGSRAATGARPGRGMDDDGRRTGAAAAPPADGKPIARAAVGEVLPQETARGAVAAGRHQKERRAVDGGAGPAGSGSGPEESGGGFGSSAGGRILNLRFTCGSAAKSNQTKQKQT